MAFSEIFSQDNYVFLAIIWILRLKFCQHKAIKIIISYICRFSRKTAFSLQSHLNKK